MVSFFLHYANGKTATTCCVEFQDRFACHRFTSNGVSFGILVPRGILCIGINRCCIFFAWCQEVEFQVCSMSVFVGCATYKLIFRMLVLAGNGHVVAWFGFKIHALLPIYGHILNELEGVHVLFVMFGHISCHLQGTIHSYIQC